MKWGWTKREWFEVYTCGCVSETEELKRHLIGYCPTHGQDRSELWGPGGRRPVKKRVYRSVEAAGEAP